MQIVNLFVNYVFVASTQIPTAIRAIWTTIRVLITKTYNRAETLGYTYCVELVCFRPQLWLPRKFFLFMIELSHADVPILSYLSMAVAK